MKAMGFPPRCSEAGPGMLPPGCVGRNGHTALPLSGGLTRSPASRGRARPPLARWCDGLGSARPMAETPSRARRLRGEDFTPAPLVDAVLSLALPHGPGGPLTVVEPSCGDGVFLAAATAALPRARAFGLELDPRHAANARSRVPRAAILSADALRGGWDVLLAHLPTDGTELWLGNPPY